MEEIEQTGSLAVLWIDETFEAARPARSAYLNRDKRLLERSRCWAVFQNWN